MNLHDVDVGGIEVVLSLLEPQVDFVDSIRGATLGPDARMQGEPGEYRLVAVPNVEIGDGVREAMVGNVPGMTSDDVETMVERTAQATLVLANGQGGTPVELSRKHPAVFAKQATMLRTDAVGGFQFRVDATPCDLGVERRDGVERVVAMVRGKRRELKRLHAWREMSVENWSPDLPGQVRVRATYLLPPTHPAALLLARSTTGAMLELARVPAQTDLAFAYFPPVARSRTTDAATSDTIDARKRLAIMSSAFDTEGKALYRTSRAELSFDEARDKKHRNAVDVIVELDPVSRDMTFGGRSRVRETKGQFGFLFAYDRQEGPAKDLDEMVQACLATVGDVAFAMNLDAAMAAAMDAPNGIIPAEWQVLAKQRYGGTSGLNAGVRKTMVEHMAMLRRFGLLLTYRVKPPKGKGPKGTRPPIREETKQARVFVDLTTSIDGKTQVIPDEIQLNPILFPSQVGIGLPKGLLRLDAARHSTTYKLGRYVGARFSMTPTYRKEGTFQVGLGVLLRSAGIDMVALERRLGRQGMVDAIRNALEHLVDGVDDFGGDMLTDVRIERGRKGSKDPRTHDVHLVASQAYLRALPGPGQVAGKAVGRAS